MIGRIISHYRILEKIGEGGMGVVYKAEDLRLRRTVALKFLSPFVLGREKETARFALEAQTAALLDDPNICSVYGIEESENRTFIVMAYVEGENLEVLLKKVRRRGLGQAKVLAIAIQIAAGLQTAHEHGGYSPGCQAGKCPDQQKGKGSDYRFWSGKADWADQSNPQWSGYGNHRLYIAGASSRQRSRSPLRYLVFWSGIV